MRSLQFLLVGISVLTLVSCSSPEVKPIEQSSTVPSKTTEVAKLSGFSGMQDVIGKTKAAIEAKNFNLAKTEFAKFEDSWKTVEDGVKVKSKTTYTAIEDGMDSTNKKIAAKDAQGAIAALQLLSKNVTSSK
ncbi:MAG: DUF4363 domain-containing protein [Cyanobacteria bacterium]|nr:DUF4363 domain-containing protein [Cyanobacteriota bacterium]